MRYASIRVSPNPRRARPLKEITRMPIQVIEGVVVSRSTRPTKKQRRGRHRREEAAVETVPPTKRMDPGGRKQEVAEIQASKRSVDKKIVTARGGAMHRRMLVVLFLCSIGVPVFAQDLSNIQ